MITVVVLVQLEAKPDKQEQVAALLRSFLSLVQAECAATPRFALRLGPSTFGNVDALPD